MKKLINHLIKAIPVLALLLSHSFAYAQLDNFTISIRNITQPTTKTLEFDVYLLDADASQAFELASCQLGFLFNSLIYTGGSVTATYSNTGSGLNAAQTFSAASTVATSTSFPNQTLIRLAGRTPPGAGNGTIISTVTPGTLITHFTITSTVDFTANSTPNLIFCSNSVVTPWYATRVSQYQGTTNTALTVTPGGNAIVVGNPILNPVGAPVAYNVTGTGSYCQGGTGLPVGLDNSQTGVTYTLYKDASAQVPTVAGTGTAISFGNQLFGTYTVKGTNGGGTTDMTGSAVIAETTPSVGGSVTGGTSICTGSTSGLLSLSGETGSVVKWQYAVSPFSSWTDISNLATTYTSGALTETTQFRAVVQSGVCTEATSAYTTVTVSPVSVGGSVTGGTSICTGSTSDLLSLSGETGSVVKWQYAVSPFSSWTDITNTATTYTSGTLTATTQFRAVVQSGACPEANSAATTVTVSPASVGGSVTGGTSICTGSTSGLLTLAGHTGTVIKWQYAVSPFSSWTDITNTATTYTSVALTATTQFRAVVQSGVCTEATSATTTVTVTPGSVGGSVTGGTTICTGSTSGLLSLSGETGSVVKWQYAVSPFSSWTDITNTATTYTSGTLTATTQFRAVVQSGACPEANSAATTVTVSPASVGGSVTGGTSICTGSTSGLLTLAGHTGTVTKWQYAVTPFSSWTDITNTATTYTSGTLTQTTQFRAVVQSGACTEVNSASTTVTVSPVSVGGSVTGGTSICTGSTSGLLSLSGETGTVVKWQYAVSPFSSWTDITNTATTYTSGTLTATTQFRAVVQSGTCSSANSSTTTVTVSPASVGGSVTGGTSICTGSTSGLLTLAGHTGTVTKWQYAVSPFSSWTDITNTATTYTSVALTQTTQFRAVVQSGTCTEANSAATTVTVSPASVGGSVTGGTTICSGSTSGLLTLSGHTGTVTKWQYAVSPFSSWTDITNTATTYTSGTLTATTQFRAVVQSGTCGSANSSTTTVTVNPATVGGSVTGGTSICTGSTSGLLTLSGHTGTVTKWQYAVSPFSSWLDITNTATTYTSGALTQTTQFRAVVQSGVCAEANSAVKEITVNPLPVPTITGLTVVSAGTTGVTYTTETSMTGYAWTVSAGGLITAGAATNVITVTWNTVGAQTVSVNYTNGNGCTAASATVYDVTVNLLPLPTINAGTDQTVCASVATVTMSGYSFTGATGADWSGGAGSWVGDIYTPTAGEKTAGSVELTYTTNTAAPYGEVSDKMTVFFQVVVIPAAGPDQTLCNTATFTMAAVPGAGTGAWTFVGAFGTAVITSPASATTTVTTVPSNTSITLRWTVTNGTCSAFDEVTVRNNPLPAAPSAGNVTATYDGLSHTGTATPPAGSSVAWYNASAGGSATVAPFGINAGVYTAWAESVNSTTGCISAARTLVTVTINKAPLSITANDEDKVYDGLAYSGGNGVTYSGFVNGENPAVLGGSLTYSGTSQGAIIAGNFVITPGGLTSANYAITFINGTLSITPKPITVKAVSKNKVYGTADPALTFTFAPALVTGDSFTGALIRTPGETVAGSPYRINQGALTAGPNYTITYVPANFYINPKVITVYAAPLQSKVYGSADPDLGYAVTPALYSGDGFTGALSREPGENVGGYAITIGTLTAGPNYSLTFVSKIFTITAKGITVTVSPGQSKTYGAADPVFAYTVAPLLVAGDSFTGVLARAAGETIAGSPYAISQGTLTAGANYTVTFVPANFVITPKPVTVTVTAGQTKVYGTTDPVFAYTFSPALVGTDAFTGAPGRVTGKNAGLYAITIGTLTAGTNYAITFVPANFLITAKPITVSAVTATKLYDGTNACAVLPAIAPALIAGDTPGFIQSYDNKMADTDKSLIPSGSVNDGNGGNNYQVTFGYVWTGVITPKDLVGSITAEDKEYDGNTTAVILIRSLTGVIRGDLVNYIGGTANFDTPDVGYNKTVTATGLSLSGPDAPNYTVNTIATATASITGAIMASTSVTAIPGSIQYSDRIILTATITGGVPPGSGLFAAKSVTFTIGGQVMKDVLNNSKIPMVMSGGNQIAILSVSLAETFAGAMSPGVKQVIATFNDVDINFHVLPNPATTSFIITQEDARATYTGDLLVPAPAGGTATVMLSAAVRDITAETGGDAFEGDISKATVSFVNRTTRAVLGTVPVTLVSPSDIKSGIAVLNWTNVPQGDYVIGIVVNNYYTRDVAAENTVVEVYEASGDYMTGGGNVIPTFSSGRYASDNGKVTNFGFALKFDEEGNVLSGRSTVLLHRTEDGILKLFKVRCTTINAVAVNIDNSSSQTGGFIGTAIMSDITNPVAPVEVADNLTFKIKLTDRGIPGTHDGIAITIWSGALLYYSSNWVTNKTTEINLADGNVIVESSFNIENDLVTGIGDITVKTAPGVEIMAYPNPSPGMVNFAVRVDAGSKATLDILSMDGTLVYRVFEGYLDSSMVKTINYDSKLPQGIYLYRLKTLNQILHGKIVITRAY